MKTLFIDFDGTIADTEALHKKAAYKTLELYGIGNKDLSPYFGIGLRDKDVFGRIKHDFEMDFDVDEVASMKRRFFIQLAEENDLHPYLKIADMIWMLPNKKYLISKGRYDVIVHFLKKWKLFNYFDGIISLSDVDVSKSEKILQMSMDNSVLLDDVPEVIAEAKAKGIEAILVKNGELTEELKG